jgi:MFS family permease
MPTDRWIRDVVRFIVSRMCITIAFQMQTVAVGWQIYALTKSPMQLGYVGLVQFLPMILLSLPAGQVADRFSRKWVSGVCVAGACLLSLSLALHARSGAPSLWPIYVALAGAAVARAFFGASNQALLAQIVPAEHFGRAVAWHTSAFQVSLIAGPSLGGALYGWVKEAQYVYFIASLLLALSVLLLTTVKAGEQTRERSPLSWESLLAGVRFVWQRKPIIGSISLDLFAVLLGGSVALLPMFAADVLKVGPEGMGILRSAPGLGAAFTALYLGWRPIRKRAGLYMFAAVVIFGITQIGFGLSRNFLLSFAFLLVSGAADVVSVVIRQTLVQLETPSAMRGRVSAVNLIFISASNELGEFESGLTAHWMGLVPAVVLGGVGTIVIALLWARLFPGLRRLDALRPSG